MYYMMIIQMSILDVSFYSTCPFLMSHALFLDIYCLFAVYHQLIDTYSIQFSNAFRVISYIIWKVVKCIDF